MVSNSRVAAQRHRMVEARWVHSWPRKVTTPRAAYKRNPQQSRSQQPVGLLDGTDRLCEETTDKRLVPKSGVE